MDAAGRGIRPGDVRVSVSLARPRCGAAEDRATAASRRRTGGHVEGGTSQFFVDVQECYVKHMPGTPPGLRSSLPETIPLESPITDASRLFEAAEHRRHVWLRDFTTQTYIDELNTYSAKLVLSEENREGLLSCIRTMIDERYGGQITKAYLTDLHVARRA